MSPEVAHHFLAEASASAPSTFWGVVVGTVGLIVVALISHPRSDRSEETRRRDEPTRAEQREDALVRDKNNLVEALIDARARLMKAGLEAPEFPDLET